MRLLERDTELRALGTAVRAVGAGSGGLVLVRGQAGVGKTRLLAALAGGARQAGHQVLQATGTELERALPFGVATALLAPPLTTAPARRRADLLAGSARGAGPLLTGADSVPGGADEAAQMALVHALFSVTVRLAETAPVVLAVDDLHWTDTATLRLLAYVARRARDLPILVAGALRPAEPGADAGLLDALQHTPGARVIAPAPLSPAATRRTVDELLGTPASTAFADACAEVTGGNPLLLRELLRVVRDEGRLGTVEDAARVREVGPEPVAWSVRSLLRRLPAAASATVQALGVLGDTVDPALAGRLARVEAPEVGEALSALERAGVVVAGEDGVSIAHPLVRQAILADLPAAERGLLHREAARLEAARGRTAAAATHLTRAPPGGEAWAVEALLDAAEAALARAAPQAATALLTRALREPPAPGRRADVLAAAGRAQAAAGDPDAAVTFAAAVAEHEDPAARARLLLALAWTHQAHGRFADAVQAAAAGLGIDGADDATVVELAAMHDAAVLWSADHVPDAARGIPARVARRAVAAGGHAARIALADRARRRMFAGDDHAATAALALQAWDDGALLRDSTADDPALVRVLTVLHNADRLADALAVADACLEDAHRRASPMARATWCHLRGHVLLYAGLLAEAEEDLREALDARQFGWGAWLPVTATALVSVLLERGEADAAAEVLAAADAATTHPRSSPMWATTQAARGRHALARGDAGDALPILLDAGRRGREELGALNPALGPWRADAVLALRALGRREEARELADVEVDGARRWGAPRALAAALRVRGLVADDPDERLTLLRSAVDVAAPGEARLEHAHALGTLGAAQRAAGAPAARDTLRTALDLADRCGATALADRTRDELRAAGGRPRRTRLAGPQSLTIGEQRVARLAAAGRSNREIADELFVTPKAVAFHLGNVYRKLGIQGRRDLPPSL